MYSFRWLEVVCVNIGCCDLIVSSKGFRFGRVFFKIEYNEMFVLDVVVEFWFKYVDLVFVC